MPIRNSNNRKTSTDKSAYFAEASHSTSPANGVETLPGHGGCPQPKLHHRVKNQRSILALVIYDSKIYAGTQGGEILVRLPKAQLLRLS